MPSSAPTRRLGRRGVEAIFSPHQEKMDPRFLFGLSAITAGATLWLLLIFDAYLKPFGTPIIGSYLSILLSSLGLILVISGTGLCRAFSIIRQVTEDDVGKDALDDQGLMRDLFPNGTSTSSLSRQYTKSWMDDVSTPSVRFGLVAFVQSCIAIALYSGLADEYQSNLSMQLWVNAVFPLARYLLNWEAVLIASAVLGLTVTQFLPGRALAE